MAARRIGDFVGDDRTYMKYLLEYISSLPPQDCIRHLEETIEAVRQCQPSTSSILSPPSADRNTSSSQLEFRLWNPSIGNWTPRSRHSSWEQATLTFFRNIPRSEEDWARKRQSAGLSDADGILRAIDSFGSDLLEDSDTSDPVVATKGDLQEALCAVGQKADRMIVAGNFCRNVSQFYVLVFIAICCVAEHLGHPLSSVNTTQRKYLQKIREGCEAGDQQLAKERTTVEWLIGEMDVQCQNISSPVSRTVSVLCVASCDTLRYRAIVSNSVHP
jgi:hypothetical protein